MEEYLTKQQETILQQLKDVAKEFSVRAQKYDEERAFPAENIADLKKMKYTTLTLPQEFGGAGEGLTTFLLGQEIIAQHCGSTSLAIGWHNMVILEILENKTWTEENKKKLFKEIADGALVNRAASEPATGSPTRGGRPETIALREGDKWILNGRKTYTSLAPALDIFLVSAWIPDEETIGWFKVYKNQSGVSIEETWDMISMQGTGSHDLLMENVVLPEEYFVERASARKASGWLLHIPACYIGIAMGARNYAIQFAKTYSPNSLKGTISELPHIQAKIGQMELELMQSRSFLYSVAQRWEQYPEKREQMGPELAAVKTAITNQAISIVDTAMRIVGAQSLQRKNPMQRYYRDVRAGLHNPPMDDSTLTLLAKSALEKQI
ncbi:acyl-CoA dehydrogenase family protein [Bacillus sp. FJAT-27986]|uniref:acyl-CoA dehydrogenase family protein n=1 Tax=Bacillus sp. FJAT-27986 TaxID=1743146 RepID=UPI00080AE637|nr:acyl-CoA dehydrogenase family protein [Bacillus sp. FJAT-27986]OCA86951.1 acyl-CoA dehydrogenase [Bacillus sp. FJAT-27986]